MTKTAYLSLDFSYEYEIAGTTLFQADLALQLAVRHCEGEVEEIIVDEIGAYRWSREKHKSVVSWLPQDGDGVKLILEQLPRSAEFLDKVHEALAEHLDSTADDDSGSRCGELARSVA